ncbi:glycosyltransferase domain-containing protein [Mangrovicoccus ximenensis]|uniref:glycosyltransferase domain-containing protein n=1 Tax=Mangrovicoccus ximenensis TaxID=1911570 RepID=UPI001374C4AB|nr:glycosyltransferase domain-containing protein [Mangrovicoccus ximenensis]
MAASPRRVVYTCLTNGYDRLIPPVDPVPGVDYVLFTDRPEEGRVKGWTTRPLMAPEGLSPTLLARFHKSMPHKVIPEYDEALWVDSNISLTSSLTPFFEDVFGGPENMIVFAHSDRDTVAAEAKTILASGRAKALNKVEGEVAGYFADGFPDDRGLIHTAVLARRHMQPDVITAMELWWKLMSEGSGRDQLSLPYVFWKQDLTVRMLPQDFTLGSPYFLRYPHWATSGRRGRALVWAAQRRQQGPHWRLLHELITRSYGDKSPHY